MAKKENGDRLLLIEQTARMLRLHTQRSFEQLGLEITVDQWFLLERIAEMPEGSQRQIAEATGKDPASITRMLDLLESRNLVARVSVPGNRRLFHLYLTRQGSAMLRANAHAVQTLHARGLKGFSQSETETLCALLLRVQENIASA